MNIVCVGDCGIDHYLPSGELHVGGITANFARHAMREFPREDTVRIVSCVGNDRSAERVLSSLEGSGIDCHISRLAGATPVQFIEIEPDGEKNFVRYDEGVLRGFRFSNEQEQIIADSELLVAPVYLQIVGLFDSLMSISTHGRVAIDFADFLHHPDFGLLERYMAQIDIGFFGLSIDDIETLHRIGELAAQYGKLFIVTLGANGSHVFDGAQRFEFAAAPVDHVIDTTGAGDAFAAGFLSRYCHGANIRDSAEKASLIAAKTLRQVGSYRPDLAPDSVIS